MYILSLVPIVNIYCLYTLASFVVMLTEYEDGEDKSLLITST
jgi:hypothetical protein